MAFTRQNLLTFFDPSTGGADKNWSLFLPDIFNSSGETARVWLFWARIFSFVFNFNFLRIIKL